jgi:glycosyltransferase involved in cell wall biosynthesis
MNKRIAFLTTLFPDNRKYLDDFLKSLLQQTYSKFDVVIVNEGNQRLDQLKQQYFPLSIIPIEAGNNPVENRENGINFCISHQYNILLFGDSDDYFSSNRVEKTIELLSKHSIVVNDLSLFNEEGVYERNYISNRLSNCAEIDYNFIKNKNIFGLSNTALNVNILERVKFDKDLIAFDWFLYKSLLKKGHSAIFTNETTTYYRQHNNNTTGLTNNNGDYLLWWEK